MARCFLFAFGGAGGRTAATQTKANSTMILLISNLTHVIG